MKALKTVIAAKHKEIDDFVVSVLEDVKIAKWGTYGPNGTDPLKYVRLIDCSSEHLVKIRQQTSQNSNHPYTLYIDVILEQRGYSA